MNNSCYVSREVQTSLRTIWSGRRHKPIFLGEAVTSITQYPRSSSRGHLFWLHGKRTALLPSLKPLWIMTFLQFGRNWKHEMVRFCQHFWTLERMVVSFFLASSIPECYLFPDRVFFFARMGSVVDFSEPKLLCCSFFIILKAHSQGALEFLNLACVSHFWDKGCANRSSFKCLRHQRQTFFRISLQCWFLPRSSAGLIKQLILRGSAGCLQWIWSH